MCTSFGSIHPSGGGNCWESATEILTMSNDLYFVIQIKELQDTKEFLRKNAKLCLANFKQPKKKTPRKYSVWTVEGQRSNEILCLKKPDSSCKAVLSAARRLECCSRPPSGHCHEARLARHGTSGHFRWPSIRSRGPGPSATASD